MNCHLCDATAMQAGLAFIAGFLEACGLIALFGLFIGHVTANIAVLGMAIATDVPGSGTKLLALRVFVAVVALTRVGMHPLRLHGHDAARLIMALELVLLLAFVAADIHYEPFAEPLGWSTVLTAALGVATLAVQNSGMRLIWRTRPSTIVMTLNLTQLVLDGIVTLREPKDATAAAARERLALVAPTLGGFLVGAAAGGLGYLIAGFYGGLVPAAVLLMLFSSERSQAEVLSERPAESHFWSAERGIWSMKRRRSSRQVRGDSPELSRLKCVCKGASKLAAGASQAIALDQPDGLAAQQTHAVEQARDQPEKTFQRGADFPGLCADRHPIDEGPAN